jgi:hypothetical protein
LYGFQFNRLEQAHNEFKVIIVGDVDVGKSSFLRRHVNGYLAKKFLAAHGCHVVPMLFSTTKSSLELQVSPCHCHHLFSLVLRVIVIFSVFEV